ncbi:MAG: hypothetical protein ACYS76_02805 [Planctomycetota bacterium]|jgi:hypothetical protein
MKKILVVAIMSGVVLVGCDSLRFAPSEAQKRNAWLHNRTAGVAAEQARREVASEKLQALAGLSELQSRAFVSHYGLPKEFPPADTAEEILSQSSFQLAAAALSESSERPNAWQVADSALELAIGISALLGGVYGARAVRFLKEARVKSKALKEVIEGNELFKKEHKAHASAFKQAHKDQSRQTRRIVAQTKA